MFSYSSRTTMIDTPELKSFWDIYYPSMNHHLRLDVAVMVLTIYPEKMVAV